MRRRYSPAASPRSAADVRRDIAADQRICTGPPATDRLAGRSDAVGDSAVLCDVGGEPSAAVIAASGRRSCP